MRWTLLLKCSAAGATRASACDDGRYFDAVYDYTYYHWSDCGISAGSENQNRIRRKTQPCIGAD